MSASPAGLVKAQIVWLQSGVSAPGALGWGSEAPGHSPETCLSSECPGDTDAARPGSAFREPMS